MLLKQLRVALIRLYIYIKPKTNLIYSKHLYLTISKPPQSGAWCTNPNKPKGPSYPQEDSNKKDNNAYLFFSHKLMRFEGFWKCCRSELS